jgi:S1-C subfamily serine protease
MSFFSPHRRDAKGRAARLAGGAVLVLVIGITAAGLVGSRLGLWGRGVHGSRPGRGDAGRGVAIVPADPATAGGGREDAGAGPGRRAIAGDARTAEGPGAGPGSEGEKLLEAWGHFERQIDAAMARARESVVVLEYTARNASASRRRFASGVVISHHGEILSIRIEPPPARGPAGSSAPSGTSQDQAPIVARDHRGHRHAAQWVAADPYTGLTLLRVSSKSVRPIRAAAEGPKLGSRVFVVGNPFGMGHSVSPGYVAGLDRSLEHGTRQFGGLIQVQAPLYPGDSGAAVVDVRGHWLGLIRGRLATPGMSSRPSTYPDAATGALAQGPRKGARPDAPEEAAIAPGDASADRLDEQDSDFGFAIPTRDALWIADQLRAHGRVDRACLGVHLETAPVSAGPAAPEPVSPPPAASSASASPPDASGSWRGPGATALSDPASDPAAASTANSPADRDGATLPGEGARVHDVLPNTPAERADLRPGDRIIALDGQPIRSQNDLINRLDRISAGSTILLHIARDGDLARPRFEVSVPTSSRPDSVPSPSPSAPPDPRSSRASVSVTPTASNVDPPASGSTSTPAGPKPPTPDRSGHSETPSAGSNPSPPGSGEGRPGPSSAVTPPSTPRQDAAPAPMPAPPDRAEAASAAVPPPVLNELGLTLPRAVERIEQLERRIQELEQFRDGAGFASAREPDSKAQSDRAKSPVGRRP